MRTFLLVMMLWSIGAVSYADVEWNGFGSTYLASSFNKNFLLKNFTDSSMNFEDFSLMGLNVGGRLDESLTFGSQLVAQDIHGDGVWGLSARWAFLKEELSGFTIKLGRQLLPILLGSEFESVHYLLPYRAVPSQMQLMINSSQFDGLTISHKFGLGSDSLIFSIFGGSPQLDPIPVSSVTVSGESKDLLGATVVFQGQGYQLQAMALRQSRDYTVSVPSLGYSAHYAGDVTAMTTGYRYDRGSFVSWGEWGFIKSDNGVPTTNLTPAPAVQNSTFLHYVNAGYVLFGYHLGPWMPRYTFASTEGTLGYQAQHSEIGHTVGFNYTLNPQAVLKFDFEYVYLPDPDKGPASATRPQVTYDDSSHTFTVPPGADAKSGSACYIGVDFIF